MWVWALSVRGSGLPGEWQHEQHFTLAAPGLTRLELPVETLDAARPGLEDLRLYDESGNELPYLVDRPKPAARVVRNARSFQVSLNAATTVITLETGFTQGVDAVTLETPAPSFIKAVQVEGSVDGQQWQVLARGQPIFRQADGVSQLQIAAPAGMWRWLRLSIDDQRSRPVPFTGARLRAAAVEAVPSESLPAAITDRQESPGETRLTLNLGAANLDLASIRLEASDLLFTRRVTVAAPRIGEDGIREERLAEGTVYRVAVDGQPASASLAVPLETRVESRELLLFIRNQDSPPLSITKVSAQRRPVCIIFLARTAGSNYLLTGNRRCGAPSYDLAALATSLKSVPISPIQLSRVADNPNYRAPEALPGIEAAGTPLDVSAWGFRKAAKLNRAGAQQLELDPEVLSHAQPGLNDLRLVRAGSQLPYIIERTSINRALHPAVTVGRDSKEPRISRWTLKLADAALPVTRLSCRARTPLFQREVALYEEVADNRGEKSRRPLGGATWTQTPDRPSRELVLGLNNRPEGDTLIVETDNGDNPALELEGFQFFYPATRLLFKAPAPDEIFLFYGNPQAAAPRYDLGLVAGQLRAADKAEASPGAEEPLKKGAGRGQVSGQGGLLFWGALALVVVGLLVIIARLLPKTESKG